MQQIEAVKLAMNLATTGETHQDYDRVVKMAEKLLILITGENIGSLLIQFVQRETAEMFQQRLDITSPTTPAIANSLMQPFDTVGRNDKVKKFFDFKDEGKNKIIKSMIDGYFGSKRRKGANGMEYWLKTRFKDLSFSDPNAWIVNEWEATEANKEIEPHPFEVSSREAVNFSFINEELRWLFVRLDIEFYSLQDDGTSKLNSGLKYTLYEEDNTIVICEVCPKQMRQDGIEVQSNEQLVEINKRVFLLSNYEPKIGYPAAFRVGYKSDPATKGRTMVSPLHPALTYFMKSLKTVSEMDISMTLHAFPQKLQYVQKCMGESRQKTCQNGYVNGTSDKCGACKGTGYKVHTTGQDAILLPMPDDGVDMIKLSDILEYKSPPIDLIKFQDEYTKGLKIEAHLAVFNSQMFITTELQSAKTATEIDANVQGIYNTIAPYTDKISEVYKDNVNTFAILAAVVNPEEGDNAYQFPADLKLKTASILLAELKSINDSGAPSFMRDAIANDLAEISFNGDDLGYKQYQVRHKFFPFNGKTPDEIAMLMSSQFVSEFTKVLYANFESIFTDIEIENPTYPVMNSYAKQWQILEAKVFQYIEELKQPEPQRINFGAAPDPDIPTPTGDNKQITDPNPAEVLPIEGGV